MKTYEVTVPIAGSCYLTVEGPDDATADQIMDLAMAAWEELEEDDQASAVTWEFLQTICSGNVCHAPQWDLEFDAVPDDE